MYSKIPYELKELNRWGNFKLVPRKNKKDDKLPIDSKTGGMGSTSDEKTWSDYETAVAEVEKYDGLIFYFKEPYIGIDLDDIEDEIIDYKNGNDENIVGEFTDQLNSYTEISPSGTGIHIIIKGGFPDGRKHVGDVEMYPKGRFFTMTGDSLGGFNHIYDDTDINIIGRLHEKYLGTKEVNFREVRSEISGVGNHLSEDETIEKAQTSLSGARFEMLFNGEWEKAYPRELYPNVSQSEADLGFSNMLAFWTGRDYDKMDSIFRRSGLYRKKWDTVHDSENTYGQMTLTKAIRDTKEVWKSPNLGSIEEGKSFILIPEEKKKVETRYYSYSDTGNGERFHDEWESIMRYNHNRGKWVIYDRGKWHIDEQENSRVLVNELLRRMVHEPILVADGVDEKDAQNNLSKHLKYSRSTTGKNNMLKEAQTLLRVASEDFDNDLNFLNMKNGYLDLTTGELHEHDKDKFFLNMTNTEYSENLDYPKWQEFLNTIFNYDKELIAYVQRAVGYSMSGETIEEKMFILHGNGRNGKSVFLHVITEMLGDYTMNIDADTLMAKQYGSDASGPSGHIARLQGARFVTSSEPNEGMRFDEGQLKSMTGTGDKITARYMRSEPFDFTPIFKIWLATNYRPKIAGSDDGIWRRLSVIPFTVQIPEDEVDKRLSDKLMEEMTGIMKWAVEGYEQWQKIGLAEPETVRAEVAEYRKEMDIIELWIDEKCERDVEAFETNENLYASYKRWASDTNSYTMNKRTFDKQTLEKFEYDRISSGRGRIGLKINQEHGHNYSDKVIKLDFDNVLNDKY